MPFLFLFVFFGGSWVYGFCFFTVIPPLLLAFAAFVFADLMTVDLALALAGFHFPPSWIPERRHYVKQNPHTELFVFCLAGFVHHIPHTMKI